MDFSLSVDASFLFSPQVEILQPGAGVDGVTGGLGGVLAHFRVDGDLRVQAEQLQRLRIAGDPQRRRLQVTQQASIQDMVCNMSKPRPNLVIFGLLYS